MFVHLSQKYIKFKNLLTFGNKRLETCLNGENANFSNILFKFFVFFYEKRKLRQIETKCLMKHNSVPNQLLPQKLPGLYMIRCLVNDWRYYGESCNVSGRLASHKSYLNRKIHPNRCLQKDWDLYGSQNFDFIVLFLGNHWQLNSVRRTKETELIVLNRQLCYNILIDTSRSKNLNPFWGRLHTPETKKKISKALKGRPNNLLGLKINIKGVLYPSIAEASRQTGIARKTIRNKINDHTNSEYIKIE